MEVGMAALTSTYQHTNCLFPATLPEYTEEHDFTSKLCS